MIRRNHIRFRHWMLVVCVAALVKSSANSPLLAQEGAQVYLTVDQAPRVVLPNADQWERRDIRLTPAQAEQARKLSAPAKPTIWEPFYISFVGKKAGQVVGYAVICEEIGKHRPITFIVSAAPDGKVLDVAIMSYREPVGGEIRQEKFLDQFSGKNLRNPILQYRDIHNISGATLSVQALSRGVRKALAVMQVAFGI